MLTIHLMFRKFQTSGVQRETDVFFCMIKNLFEEYKFFPQYPDKETYATKSLAIHNLMVVWFMFSKCSEDTIWSHWCYKHTYRPCPASRMLASPKTSWGSPCSFEWMEWQKIEVSKVCLNPGLGSLNDGMEWVISYNAHLWELYL